ncbi:MAG TPA: DUF4402 domain-containing protein [Sphingomicrobium sp.]|nr:DUF4402 domain-containing protein [Sphingomicrobium sp.]
MGLRLTDIAIVLAAAAAAAAASPAHAATVTAQARAKVVKPLVLTSIRDLELGTLVLAGGSWPAATVTLSSDGTLTCPANITCIGTTQTAGYNISGSNNETITVNAPDVTLVNQSDSTKTLTLVVDAPTSLNLPNSGNPGVDFAIGGSIDIGSATAEGDYAGTFKVTVDYQ